MAARSWITAIGTALGVAAGAGAAQLGIGYGLNIVTWAPATDEETARTLWLASLAWVAWLAANSTVIGALCADRLSNRGQAETAAGTLEVLWRIVIALAAATGALISVPLVAVPARLAPQANNATPEFTAGGYAIIGILVGLVVAIGALHASSIATNVIASAGWSWVLAIGAVAYGLRTSAHAGSAQLATWQFSGGIRLRGMVSLPGALLMLGAALAIGFLASWAAGRRGEHRVGVVISGATGPLLVTAAYFLALPGLDGSLQGLDGSLQQLSAAVVAPYTVIAGLAGSVLVSAIGPRGSREKTRAEREAADEQSYEEWQRAMAIEVPGSDGDTPNERPTVRLPGTRKKSSTRSSTSDLADDAYAPPGAYASDSPPDSPSTPPKSKRGRSRVPEPIWPEEATAGSATEPVVPSTADPASVTSASTTSGGKGGRQRKRR